MSPWRYVLAIVFSMVWLAVFVFWTQVVNPPKKAPPAGKGVGGEVAAPQEPGGKKAGAGEAGRNAAKPGAGQAAPKPGAEQAAPKPGAAEGPGKKKGFVARERRQTSGSFNGRIRYVADTRGACLSRVFLPQYHETVDRKDPYELLRAPPEGFATLSVSLDVSGVEGSLIPCQENWVLEGGPDKNKGKNAGKDVEGGAAGPGESPVVFSNKAGGIEIRKEILPGDAADVPAAAGAGDSQEPHHLKLRLELKNTSGQEQKLSYRVYGPTQIDSESIRGPGSDIELVVGEWGSRGTIAVDTLSASRVRQWERPRGVAWVGVSNNYFTSILFPITKNRGDRIVGRAFAESIADWRKVAKLALDKFHRDVSQLDPESVSALEEKAYKNVRPGLQSIELTLAPGQSVVHEYGLYLGTRNRGELDRYGALRFGDVNQYGMFSFLVKIFIWLLEILKTICFGSWGAAIILLTLLVKLCLHPINKKSQGSMQRFQKKMQKVKPEMDALKERYSGNRMKMNQEMQKLWKEHGINPGQQMAGCLILFLQLPIWLGLYRTLQYAIGLRQASFLYIPDLTRPDQLFHLGLHLPIVGSMLEYFNLLPVLYVILTVVNQRLQPRPDDPQMQTQFRMMTFMMVFFGFIFYSFPAGFMLYIMTSAGLGIIESKIIKAELAREETAVPQGPGASKGAGKGGKTGKAGDSGKTGGAMYVVRARKGEGGGGRAKKGKKSRKW